MRKVLLMALGGAVVLAGSVVLDSKSSADDIAKNDRDFPVCYKVLYKSRGGDDSSWYDGGWGSERDRQERLNLDIKFHSYLFGDRQPVYDVQGKRIVVSTESKRRGFRADMETAHGTLITNNSEDDYFDRGARLGVETMGVLRGANNVTFDCTTDDNDVPPKELSCKVRADGDRNIRRAKLQQADDRDRFCDVFRDSKWKY